jgi:hypothetical protein
LEKDLKEKCQLVDTQIRGQFWYYIQGADLVSNQRIPTTDQYYCVFTYVNIAGTFLSIAHWDLVSKTGGSNTFVRLGNGYE